MPLAPGTRVGSFEILSLLGSGGMGEVYRARDRSLGRDVAIKVLPASIGTDPERRSRFACEARALAVLSHANIATVHDFAEANGHPYLVLELIEGPTVADRLRTGPLPIDEALDVARSRRAARRSIAAPTSGPSGASATRC